MPQLDLFAFFNQLFWFFFVFTFILFFTLKFLIPIVGSILKTPIKKLKKVFFFNKLWISEVAKYSTYFDSFFFYYFNGLITLVVMFSFYYTSWFSQGVVFFFKYTSLFIITSFLVFNLNGSKNLIIKTTLIL